MSRNIYYQHFADVSRIFWEFHRAAVERGVVPPTVAPINDSNPKAEPLVLPLEMIQHELGAPIHDPYDIIEAFAKGTRRSLLLSWDAFLEMQGIPVTKTAIPYDNSLLEKFRDTRVTDLILQTEQLARVWNRLGSHEGKTPYLVQHAGTVGMNTASSVVAQLQGIFDGRFRVNMVKLMAKISLEYAPESRKGIGLSEAKERPSYSLIKDGRLDLDMLRGYGFGAETTHGCPAGWPPTPETATFLQQITGRDCRGSTIPEFSAFYGGLFGTQVVDFYNTLPETFREGIAFKNREVLEGAVLQRSYRQERK